MQQKTTSTCPRTIGLDCHPDSFTAALLRGETPAAALTEKLFNKVPMRQLANWAQKHTDPGDCIVLEASGNSFQAVRTLAAVGRKALVLESAQLGKLKEAHANNDKISAVRIAKGYLAGTAKRVWVPDEQTQERRDCFHAYMKAVRRTTQMINRINSYLSDQGVRLPVSHSIDCQRTPALVERIRPWSVRQQALLKVYFQDLEHAQGQRRHWERLIAQEVIEDPLLLSLVRLCGVRHITAFCIGAIVGDIGRFENPKKLVKYAGLNPAFDDSGNNAWHGGVSGHGRKDLRSILMQGAQAVLRSDHALGRWGRRLLARKGQWNLAVAAVARKLLVAIWYLLKGQWTQLDQIDAGLQRKVGKILSDIGPKGFAAAGRKRKDIRAEVLERLKTGRVYLLGRGTLVIENPAQ